MSDGVMVCCTFLCVPFVQVCRHLASGKEQELTSEVADAEPRVVAVLGRGSDHSAHFTNPLPRSCGSLDLPQRLALGAERIPRAAYSHDVDEGALVLLLQRRAVSNHVCADKAENPSHLRTSVPTGLRRRASSSRKRPPSKRSCSNSVDVSRFKRKREQLGRRLWQRAKARPVPPFLTLRRTPNPGTSPPRITARCIADALAVNRRTRDHHRPHE